ncbi:MAG: tRNA (adenosine(37)-N6)-threonylcarbamoyltransferase complex transferase subunit TsaD [Acholeplasmataceae bacterium]|nr:tRNA (adenosine(37)-N6)-threonylcarbamoyltransferase complex transferase subunit TsaD [Acholeplasmataceae bacterium]
MIILAVESSCDETSVAIVKDGKTVLSHVILSQIDIHQAFGGVVPEIASRNHVVHMTRVFDEAIKQAKITTEAIDLVAVTKGPGLIGSLLVGINAATAFAFAHQKPLIGVNHLVGHIYAANIEYEIQFPALALLVSGGHTELLYIKDHLEIEMLGTTLDDAVGEAYDKVARTLGLSYPGGPIIDKLAQEGEDTYHLPRVYLDKDRFDFSFSGLKSAVINVVHNANQKGETIRVNDMCRSFQESVLDVLVDKTKRAAELLDVKQIILAGGVAANQGLRKRIQSEIKKRELLIPSLIYCTDNAAMIGIAAYYQYQKEGAHPNYLLGGESTISFPKYTKDEL